MMSSPTEKAGVDAAIQAYTAASSLDRVAVETVKVEEKGLDDALLFANEHHIDSVTPEEDRRMLWKIDFTILPIVCLLSK